MAGGAATAASGEEEGLLKKERIFSSSVGVEVARTTMPGDDDVGDDDDGILALRDGAMRARRGCCGCESTEREVLALQDAAAGREVARTARGGIEIEWLGFLRLFFFFR